MSRVASACDVTTSVYRSADTVSARAEASRRRAGSSANGAVKGPVGAGAVGMWSPVLVDVLAVSTIPGYQLAHVAAVPAPTRRPCGGRGGGPAPGGGPRRGGGGPRGPGAAAAGRGRTGGGGGS